MKTYSVRCWRNTYDYENGSACNVSLVNVRAKCEGDAKAKIFDAQSYAVVLAEVTKRKN